MDKLVRCVFYHFRTNNTHRFPKFPVHFHALLAISEKLRITQSERSLCNVRTSVRSLFSVPWPWPWRGHTLLDNYQARYNRSESPSIGISSHSFALVGEPFFRTYTEYVHVNNIRAHTFNIDESCIFERALAEADRQKWQDKRIAQVSSLNSKV